MKQSRAWSVKLAGCVGVCLSLTTAGAALAGEGNLAQGLEGSADAVPIEAIDANYAIELQEETVCSVVTGDDVNIRQGPGLEYAVTTQLDRQDGVRAVYRDGNWVRLAARVFGFSSSAENEPFAGWVVFEPLSGWVFNQFIDGCSEEQADRWRVATDSTQALVLALDSEGLRLVNPSTGSARALPFGAAERDVVSTLSTLRGDPSDRGVNPECGAGPLAITSWADGLTILSSEGEFAGWTVDGRRPDAPRLTTINGLGVGLTRSEVEQIIDVDVRESTLGFEFFDGIGGIFTEDGPNAELAVLYAGTTCFFR